jgi:hypothetical protein
MTDTSKMDALSEMDAYQEFVQKLAEQIDPREFLTPTQREIAYMSLEELEQEYLQVQSRQSNRGKMQRDLITSRWEHEQKNSDNESI